MTETTNKETFLRFNISERIQHLLLLISMTILSLTGLPQIFIELKISKYFLSVLGGLALVRKIHHFASVILGFTFLFHIIYVFSNLIARPSFKMLPRVQDFHDAILEIKFLRNKTTLKPAYDRFDFKQKLEYWALIWGTGLMGITGLMLMFPEHISKFIPGEWIFAAKIAHGLEALLAVSSILTWLMYHTHFSEHSWPIDTTMFTGQISQERMLTEHSLEYQSYGKTPANTVVSRKVNSTGITDEN